MRCVRHVKKTGIGLLHGIAILLAVFSLASGASTATNVTAPLSDTPSMIKVARNPCNPCAAKTRMNPCNPCGAKNPCNPCGAGGRVDPKLVTRPTGTGLYTGAKTQLIKEGERLWQDRTLGTNGLACGTCHINFGNLKRSFLKSYPHRVEMPLQRSGLQQVDLDEMVQFCMVVPMASKPLAWDSRELAALTAYAEEVQKDFVKAVAANPCMLKQAAANPCNPCAAKNPCNPCAAKARMNPCNPCAAKNPCNPCAAKNPCGKKK